MKNIFKILIASFVALLVISCEKDEERAVLNTPSDSKLQADKTNVVLTKDHEADKLITFTWARPDYGVSVAQKSQLQFAKKGGNFAGAKIVEVQDGTSTLTFTVAEFNKIMLDAGLTPDVATDVEVRLASTLGAGTALYSNVISLNATAYMTAFPSFYIVGDASAPGWNAADAQLLNKVENLSTIYTYLENGKNFRFLGQQDWGPTNYSLDAAGIKDAYKYFKTWSTNMEASPDENIKFNGATGIYKIVIDADATKKSLTVTPSAIPTYNVSNLYVVGSINGWSADNAIPMAKVGEGVFEVVQSLPDGSEFKFIGQKSWGDLEWANITEAGNTGFLGPKGDNNNIKIDGGGASYKITANIKRGTFKVVKQ